MKHKNRPMLVTILSQPPARPARGPDAERGRLTGPRSYSVTDGTNDWGLRKIPRTSLKKVG